MYCVRGLLSETTPPGTAAVELAPADKLQNPNPKL